jgi:WD40 repeat protein
VVSSSGDKRVRIHNGANGAVARTFSEMQTWLHCVAMTPDSTVVAAGDAGGTITIWNGTNGQQLQKFSQDP